MKRLFVFAIAAMMAASLNAQDVSESSVRIGNLNAPAYTLTLQKDKKVVQKALDQRLKDAKLKTKKSEGFDACLGVIFQEIAPTPINLYTKVDGNSKECTLMVCAMSNDLSANQQVINRNVSSFLNNFTKYLAKREAAEQLAIAQEDLEKAQKEQKAATSELNRLEKVAAKNRKKIEDLQKRIKKWQQSISDAETDIRKYNSDIEKATNGKLPEAQKRVENANQAVNEAQATVEKWQKLAH